MSEKQNKSNHDKPSFEEAMVELEDIVQRLETGDVPLEKAIQLFQKGMELSKTCHQKLEKVERQVHLLLEEDGQLMKKDFNLEEDPS